MADYNLYTEVISNAGWFQHDWGTLHRMVTVVTSTYLKLVVLWRRRKLRSKGLYLLILVRLEADLS